MKECTKSTKKGYTYLYILIIFSIIFLCVNCVYILEKNRKTYLNYMKQSIIFDKSDEKYILTKKLDKVLKENNKGITDLKNLSYKETQAINSKKIVFNHVKVTIKNENKINYVVFEYTINNSNVREFCKVQMSEKNGFVIVPIMIKN